MGFKLVFSPAGGDNGVISGEVVFPVEAAAKIPAGATVKVSLQDVSLADAPSKEIASTVIKDATGFPVKYSLSYDVSVVKPGHRYSISARIEDGSGLRFLNDTSHPVFGKDWKPGSPFTVKVIKVK